MSINLNVNKYGAQFSAFVDFAKNTADENTIVCVSEDKTKTKAENEAEFENRLKGIDGTPRAITAKTVSDRKGKIFRRENSKNINNDVRGLFLRTVLAVCGVKKIDDLPPAVLDVMRKNDFEADGRPLTVRRIRAVSNAIFEAAGASAHQTTAAAFVSGDNTAAVGQLQRLVATAPGLPANATPEEKSAVFAAKMSEAAAKETATNFTLMAARYLVDRKGIVCVENLDKTHYQFDRDRGGSMRVKIEGVGELDKDYEKARDQLVQFVTGDGNATFAGSEVTVKRQVGILMSIMTQFTANSVESAFNKVINENGGACAPFGNSSSPVDTPMNYSLSKAKDGGIQITFGQTNGLSGLMLTEGGKATTHYVDTNRSCYSVGLDIKLPAGHLEELAQADWSEFDLDAYEAEGNKDGGKGQYASIPDQYLLKASVNASIHYEIYTDPTM